MHKKLTLFIPLTLCLLAGCTSKDNTAYLDKTKIENNNKAMRINLWIFFILYLVLLITLTLFDPMWRQKRLQFF